MITPLTESGYNIAGAEPVLAGAADEVSLTQVHSQGVDPSEVAIGTKGLTGPGITVTAPTALATVGGLARYPTDDGPLDDGHHRSATSDIYRQMILTGQTGATGTDATGTTHPGAVAPKRTTTDLPGAPIEPGVGTPVYDTPETMQKIVIVLSGH